MPTIGNKKKRRREEQGHSDSVAVAEDQADTAGLGPLVHNLLEGGNGIGDKVSRGCGIQKDLPQGTNDSTRAIYAHLILLDVDVL